MVFLAASLAVATSSLSAAPAAAQAPPVLPADTAPAQVAFPPPDSGAPPPPPGAAPVGTRIAASTGAFGTPGQLVLTVGSDSLQLTILRASGSGSSSTGVLIQPGLDYFVSPNVSIGGLLSYAHASAASIGDTTYGLQVRAGYNLQLSDTFSWWLRAGLGFFHGSVSGGGSASTVPFQLYVPVLWHLVPHVFLGFGPTITTDLVTSNDLPKETFLGAQLILGGYFGVR
jgi:hypothetical protein